jgi:hypothetical protein
MLMRQNLLWRPSSSPTDTAALMRQRLSHKVITSVYPGAALDCIPGQDHDRPATDRGGQLGPTRSRRASSTATLPSWYSAKLADQLRLDLGDSGFVHVRDSCRLKVIPDGIFDEPDDISSLAHSQGSEFLFEGTG